MIKGESRCAPLFYFVARYLDIQSVSVLAIYYSQNNQSPTFSRNLNQGDSPLRHSTFVNRCSIFNLLHFIFYFSPNSQSQSSAGTSIKASAHFDIRHSLIGVRYSIFSISSSTSRQTANPNPQPEPQSRRQPTSTFDIR